MKRIDELQDLSRDHYVALGFALRCRQSGAGRGGDLPVQVWSEVAPLFTRHLDRHFLVEEELLVPALVRIGESDMASRLLADHARLRELGAAAFADQEQVLTFGRLLERHVRFEEREVFQLAQERLPEAELRAIAAASRREGVASPQKDGSA
jgi:hemerythrin-like domain-containing protein